MPRNSALRRYLSRPVLNSALTKDCGRDVLLVEVLPVADGQRWSLRFEHVDPRWPAGVWFAVDGELLVGGARSPQMVIWTHAAPPVLEIEIVSAADGLLRLYNIWDSGRGIKPHESQAATSGMLKRERDDGCLEYRCNDFGLEPKFDRLLFVLCRETDEQ